jgi:hypothetical protein
MVRNQFLFVPYVAAGRFHEALEKEPKWKESLCIFAHQELTGAKMGPIVSQVEEWKLDNPLVISGHIHDFQEVAPNLIYVGTPIQHGFSDSVDKTISLFSWDSDSVTPKHERIDLDCKKKKIMHISVQQVEGFIPPEKTLLKLVIEGSAAQLKALANSQKVASLRALGVKVHFKAQTETCNKQPSIRKNYSEVLTSLIGRDSRQMKWYLKRFRIQDFDSTIHNSFI